ncbi:hypothetical protein LTR08_002850 [Meristemomyces frigidus]|nr:hypothetical protein LTR08_002850 [Meristemomyces frigidus]
MPGQKTGLPPIDTASAGTVLGLGLVNSPDSDFPPSADFTLDLSQRSTTATLNGTPDLSRRSTMATLDGTPATPGGSRDNGMAQSDSTYGPSWAKGVAKKGAKTDKIAVQEKSRTQTRTGGQGGGGCGGGQQN